MKHESGVLVEMEFIAPQSLTLNFSAASQPPPPRGRSRETDQIKQRRRCGVPTLRSFRARRVAWLGCTKYRQPACFCVCVNVPPFFRALPPPPPPPPFSLSLSLSLCVCVCVRARARVCVCVLSVSMESSTKERITHPFRLDRDSTLDDN